MINLILRRLFLFIGVSVLSASNLFSQSGSDAPQKCKPSVSKIIETLRVDEVLSLGQLQVSCIEIPKGDNPRQLFDPYKDPKLISNLKNSRGETLNSFVWYGEKYLNRVNLTKYEIVGGREALKILTAGEYKLEFTIGGMVFYTFPFNIKTRKSNDPYRPGTVYMSDGDWRTDGTLDLIESTGYFKLNSWYRDFDNTAEKKPRSIPFAARIIRNRDKKVMAVASTSGLRLDNNWAAIPISFEKPRSDQNPKAYKETVSDILSTDGKYTIETKIEGKPYINYEFEVKNRKINDVELNPRRNFIFVKGKSL